MLFYTITTFSLSYGTEELGLRNSTLLYATLISVAIMGLAVPVFATLSDRLGRRNLCMAGALLALLWAFPMFWLVDTYSGASVSYNLGGVLGGAFAPILASSLLIVAGGSWAISLYIALMALLSLLCVFSLSETHLAEITGMREERDVLADGGVVAE